LSVSIAVPKISEIIGGV